MTDSGTIDPTNPLDYTCPECDAQAGEACHTQAGADAAHTHKARLDLAGARDVEQNPAPNPEQVDNLPPKE